MLILQVAAVCDHLAGIPQLSQGYNAVGFSQGSQFLRAVLERCQHLDGMPKMHTLITLGGQHQGIMNGPACSGPSFNHTPSTPCKVVQRLLGFGAYLPWIRSHIVQAQYFKVNIKPVCSNDTRCTDCCKLPVPDCSASLEEQQQKASYTTLPVLCIAREVLTKGYTITLTSVQYGFSQ